MKNTEVSHDTVDKWKGWTRKRRVDGKKISRSISDAKVTELTSSWYLARRIGQDLNRFVTIRPHDIDDLTPDQRRLLLARYRNKLGQFARDHGFEFTHIWSRESDPKTGLREHLHILMHVPAASLKDFKRVVDGWARYGNEIDVKPCSYQTRVMATGKVRSMVGYLTKNSPQAAYMKPREYRLGGPVLGKRTGCSANLNTRAQSLHEAQMTARRNTHERRHMPAISTVNAPDICTAQRYGITNFDANAKRIPSRIEFGSDPKIRINSIYEELRTNDGLPTSQRPVDALCWPTAQFFPEDGGVGQP